MTDKLDMRGIPALTSPNRRHHDVGSSFTIRPHDGYRQYFETGVHPSEISALFSGDDLTSNFPSVRYAAGWVYADHAIGPDASSLEEREGSIRLAEAQWEDAIRLTGTTYELLPGKFLLWPCTKWRYRFAVDTVPTLQAIAQARESGQRDYDANLLEQSRQNVNKTIRILMGKYAWTMAHYTQPDSEPITPEQLNGRLGSIIGVAIEGAALSAAQLGEGNEHAVLPPSLRSDYAGQAAIDLIAHTTRNMIFSAQVKKKVHPDDRKKYRGVALVCASHHMKRTDERIEDIVTMIGNDTDTDRTRQIGDVVLKVMKGSQRFGCSPANPRPAHTIGHKPRVALAVAS